MMTQKQQAALQALLTQPTRKAAANAAGIDEKTLRKYLSEPEFMEAYRAASDEVFDTATQQLRQTLSPVIKTLRSIVSDEEESSSARIAASRTLLEYTLRFVEVNDILKALDAAEGEA